ncbi:GTPase-activating Rap/Ran-GAP domain-like protein 3, partial [Mizuhopecten yessoensis]|uniref:GTPase-activating Rap/Ran-GAP domain-like protein 3 n=1 Tax=Mizuhopecten yessoensis TaxID=6573 RepID=UPI000B458E0F
PWEPQQIHLDFHHHIHCGDSWGDKLVLATDAGTVVLEEGLPPRTIFDRTVLVKQLTIVEAHGLLVLRSEKGKDSKVHVFRLLDFEGEYNEHTVRTRLDCRDHRLDKTKGCHLYALSRPGTSHLRMVVAVQRRLLLFTWKHSAAWSAWCPTVDFEIADGFSFVRELHTDEPPLLVTLIDGNKEDNQICVGYKNQFDLINEKNGDTLQLYHVEANKVKLVSALDIYEDEEAELLLCYNHVSHFQKLSEETSHDFDFHWNSEPQAIVCAFPYVMAFTQDTIEIRLIINGNLVHTMAVADLKLLTSKSVSPSTYGKCRTNSQSIFKIPLSCLAGQMHTDKSPHGSPSSQCATLLAPIINNGDKSPLQPKRSPLVRTKCVSTNDKEKDRHDSSSSDSGINILKPSEGAGSPPQSPYQKCLGQIDFTNQDVL